MSLKFPKVKEVHLKNPPLREVVFQIKFPPILRISHEDPYEFQDRIRELFPIYRVENPVKVPAPRRNGGDNSIAYQPPIYRFLNEQETEIVSLAQDFCAYSTLSYKNWIEFKSKIVLLTKATREVYKSTYANRLGLRYINILEPEKYNRSLEEILSAVRPELTCMLKTKYYPLPQSAIQEIRISDGDNHLTLRHGLVKEQDSRTLKFLIDLDHYKQGKVDFDGIQNTCEDYHTTIYRAFRWCILPEALKMMT